MAEHHQKMLQEIKDQLVKGNNMLTFDVANLEETYAAEEDEELARPGFTVQEKESDMTKQEYLDVMKEFLSKKASLSPKELLYQYYKDFKIFNKALLKKQFVILTGFQRNFNV